MKRLLAGLALLALILVAGTIWASPAAARTPVFLTGHVQDLGWMDTGYDEAGTTGRSLRLEAVQFTDPTIIATGHVQDLGWMPETTDTVGTTGHSLRLEALQLSPRFPGWRVWCQAHVQGIGWMEPVTDGQTCGTTGRSLRLEAVRVWLEPIQ